MRSPRFATLSLTLLLGALPAQQPSPGAVSNETPQPASPRIGLVLSGGGARGAAHVGVLQVLEELRVPVHCVVGTSMGSIVGGLYAYGHSPAALADLVTRNGSDRDWDYLLQDGDGRPGMAFRRKEESKLLTGRIKLGLKGLTLRLPKGWIQGQNLETELRFSTDQAHDLRSFDDLPLPFRCVAVDIGTGEQVVLDRGNLALALRASMSLPGVFAPAVIDGRELLDGGLVNNVPVDVARALGCDVLIVVDIGSPLAKAEDVVDLLDVTTQTVAILTQQNVDRSLASLGGEDTLIQPPLGDITSMDFLRAQEAIDIGAAATRAVAERLRRYSVDPVAFDAFLQRQRRAPSMPTTIRGIVVDNRSSFSDRAIISRVGAEPGKPISQQSLRDGLARLYSTDDLQRVGFAFKNRKGDTADLELRPEDKSWGVDSLQVGLRLESNFEDLSRYELGLLYTKKHLNALGGELRLYSLIGSESALYGEFYQPLAEDGSFFIAPNGFVAHDSGDAYSGSTKIAVGTVDYMIGGLDVGTTIGSIGELRVGAFRAHGSVDIDLSVLPFPVPKVDFDDGAAHVRLRLDTLDDAIFPRHGLLSSVEYILGSTELGADADYQFLQVTHSQAASIGDSSAVLLLEADFTLDDTLPFYARPSLGGFLRLSGLPPDSLSGQHAALGALMLRQKLTHGIAPLYIGGSVEAGNAWQQRSEQWEQWLIAASLFLAVDTPVGPLHFGAGITEGGHTTGFMFLGPTR